MALCFLYGNNMVAQNLEYEEQTKKDDICTYGNVHACITIIADKSLNLGFNSNLETPEQILSTMDKVVVGDLIHYTLHFKTGKEGIRDYRNRTLEISSSLYPKKLLKIFLDNLQPKESQTYLVTLTKCYDPLFSEGNTLFFAGKYQEAREKYVKAKDCLDKKNTSLKEGDVEEKIILIDSIMTWIEKADESMLLLDYNTAITYYGKVTSINPLDQQNTIKKDNAVHKQGKYCYKCLTTANRYYERHEYDKALELYKRLIDENCDNKEINEIAIEDIRKKIEEQKYRYSVFIYEFGLGISKKSKIMLPVSFSTGKYLDNKVGGYFSFATNPAFFNMLRSNYSKASQADIGISFGINFRTVKPRVTKYFPVWLHFGIGYTLMGAYHYKDSSGKEEFRYEGGKLPDTELNLVAYHAVAFETGLLLKLKWVALRYTFQYRFATKLETQEYMNQFMQTFGIGLCF